MNEIERKALELLNERHSPYEYALEDHPVPVLARAIEQHEAFRQEVSEAVKRAADELSGKVELGDIMPHLSRFIITKPDPLVEAVKDILDDDSLHNVEEFSEAILAALAKRGFEIREKE